VDLLVGLLVTGGGAFLLAGGLSYALGPSPWRMIVVAIAGFIAVVGVFVWGYADSTTQACHDCGEVLGKWMGAGFIFFLLMNFLAWPTGALLGWAVRRSMATEKAWIRS
jgi:hypothetical protein